MVRGVAFTLTCRGDRQVNKERGRGRRKEDEEGGRRSDLDGGGPVGVHLSVLVVVTLKLELQVRSDTTQTHLPSISMKLRV